MDEDRAGSNDTIGTERRVEARPGLFGFFYPVVVDAPPPWRAPFSTLQAILDNLTTPEIHAMMLNDTSACEPAKPVGSLDRPPESLS
jgi:hypothetical protein